MQEAAGGPPGLTLGPTTRLTSAKISTGQRLGKQLGVKLLESPHIGADYIVAGTNQTIDAMGSLEAYKNFGDRAKFFESIIDCAFASASTRSEAGQRGDVELEYVEVTIGDIALANELAQDVLVRGLDELAAPVRGLYEELRKLCVQRAEEMNCQPEAVLLSRREIREATGWSDWQVRSYCRQLVEMEYLYATINGNE